MQIAFSIVMLIFGAVFGSFLCCQAQRLHLRETRHKSLGARSVCLYCHHQLKWYENLPIISWLMQGGKCRHCGRKIGTLELISEVAIATAFLALSTTISITSATALEWATFAVITLLTLCLGFLAIYDGKWGELPTFMLIISGVLALAVALLRIVPDFSVDKLISTLLAVLILGGIYLALYLISHGRWVGDGDWILGTVIALTLGTPWLAAIVLFLANFSACLVMYPLVRRRQSRKIYFGPFLVFAFLVTYTFADFLTALLP